MNSTVIARLRQDHVANQIETQPELSLLRASNPDDIRAAGWAVAVHNDYRLNGVAHTFWLFTKGDRCVKGEGVTDAQALNQVREQLGPYEWLLTFADVKAMLEQVSSHKELCALNDAVTERSYRDHQPLTLTDEEWEEFTLAFRRKASQFEDQDGDATNNATAVEGEVLPPESPLMRQALDLVDDIRAKGL